MATLAETKYVLFFVFSLYRTTNEECSWHPDMAKARSVLRDKAKESFYFGPNTESLKRVSPTGPSAVTAATDKRTVVTKISLDPGHRSSSPRQAELRER